MQCSECCHRLKLDMAFVLYVLEQRSLDKKAAVYNTLSGLKQRLFVEVDNPGFYLLHSNTSECEWSAEKRESRLLCQFLPDHSPAKCNWASDPMKIDVPDELLQSDKWSFSDNVRKSGKMVSPGARGPSLWNICQSLDENLVKFSSQDWLSPKNWDKCFVGAFKGGAR